MFPGLVLMEIPCIHTDTINDLRDSFPRQSTEVFILQMMLKNFLFYAFSNFINTWAAEAGAGSVFRVFGIVSLALLALCVPMCK